MNYVDAEHWLETYSFTDILELNELDEADILSYLVEQGYLELPEVRPL